MTLRIRHLSIDEVLLRQRAMSDRDVGRHNAGIVEELQLERVPALRDQVLAEFPARARRLAR